MDTIRHIAIQVPDPWLTAEYYKRIFALYVAGETDSSIAEGVYLTDGVINLALLAFKSEEASQGAGLGHVGLHHFGVMVDDVDDWTTYLENAGAECFAKRNDDVAKKIVQEPQGGDFEVKFRGPDGVVFDISDHLWPGAEPVTAEESKLPISKTEVVET